MGLVHQTGFDSVSASKKAGLWDFMDDVDNLIVPTDLQNAINENQTANQFFYYLSQSNKRFVLRYLKLAKTEKTRQKRIIEIVRL